MIIKKHEAATGTSAMASTQVTSGTLIPGNPPATGPMTATPRSEKSYTALAATAATTANSGPGSRGANVRQMRTTATTAAEMETVGTCSCGNPRITWASCSTVLWALTVTPSISPSTAIPTWNPTPVRNPTSTVCERKSARKPSLNIRARSRKPAVSSATNAASDTYCSLATGAMVDSAPARMAAVAESAATTR